MNEIVYDSADPQTHAFVDVEVKNDDIGFLRVVGMSDGEAIAVLGLVGRKADDLWTPLWMSGVQAALRADNTQMLLDAPGWYRLDIGGFTPSARVAVQFDSLERDLVTRTPHPFTPDAATLAQPVCDGLVARGVTTTWGA